RAIDGDDDPQSASGENRDRRIRRMLLRRKNRFEMMRNVLTDAKRTSFVIVLIGERVPVLESIELYGQLRDTGVDVGGFVVNRLSPTDAGELLASRRVQEDKHVAFPQAQLPGESRDPVALLAAVLVGREALLQLAQQLS